MPTATYIPLATYTVTTNDGTVQFASIPSTYKDLILIVNHQTGQNTNVTMRFNSDSGSNYANVQMVGNGSSAISGSGTHSGVFSRLDAATIQSNGNSIYQIFDYSATDKHKTVLGRHNGTSLSTVAMASRWANTAAINTITLTTNELTWTNGATFSLYGIAG